MSSRTRLYPHRRPPEDVVEWGSWWVSVRNEQAPVEGRLDGWDYATPLKISLHPTIDIDRIYSESGLEAQRDELVVVLQVDCPATRHREQMSKPVHEANDDGLVSLTMNIPSRRIAEKLYLSAHIVHLATRTDETGTTSTKPNRLASPARTTLHLEGESGRFPTDVISFKAVGRHEAAWTIDLSYNSLNDSFMGSVRLLINSDLEASLILRNADHELFGPLTSALRVDTTRLLLTSIANDESVEVVPDADFEEESLGDVLDTICTLHLQRDLQSILELARSDPSELDLLLQSRLNFLRGLKA